MLAEIVLGIGARLTQTKKFYPPSSPPTVRRGIVKEFDAAKMKSVIGIGSPLGALVAELFG